MIGEYMAAQMDRQIEAGISKVEQLESTIDELVSALQECKAWHRSDKWRYSDEPNQRGAWNRHMKIIDTALKLGQQS